MDVVDRQRADGGGAGPPTSPRVRRHLGGVAPPPPLMLALTILLVGGTTPSVAVPGTVSVAGGQHYTDQWAVRVDGTEDDARRLAERHGFVYIDKVGTSKTH